MVEGPSPLPIVILGIAPSPEPMFVIDVLFVISGSDTKLIFTQTLAGAISVERFHELCVHRIPPAPLVCLPVRRTRMPKAQVLLVGWRRSSHLLALHDL
jgi:hypothetical protein